MKKLIAAVGALVVSTGLLLVGTGTAQAGTKTLSGTATTPALIQPVVGTVTAKFKVVDSGNSLRVTGSATGLDRNSNYVSLIYPGNTCNAAETPVGFTVDGLFQEIGDSQRDVRSEYDGVAYQAVKGKVGSVSVRRIDLTFVPTNVPGLPAGVQLPAGTSLPTIPPVGGVSPTSVPGAVTAVLTPVVCVDVK